MRSDANNLREDPLAWLRTTTLYSVDSRSDHDAVMRIGSEVLGGGPILSLGVGAMGTGGSPPPRIVLALHHTAAINAEPSVCFC
jgi:hypothetical protein